MGDRNDLREAIRANPGITGGALDKKFPGATTWTTLSKLTASGELKREGKGREATYRINDAAKGKRTARISPAGKKTLRVGARGDPIEATLAELRRRREGLD